MCLLLLISPTQLFRRHFLCRLSKAASYKSLQVVYGISGVMEICWDLVPLQPFVAYDVLCVVILPGIMFIRNDILLVCPYENRLILNISE